MGVTVCAQAQTTYTWTGAVDGDWANASNWDANGVPVDDLADDGGNGDGLTLSDLDLIVFSAATMPSTNIPAIGGSFESGNTGANSTPSISFVSGGAIAFDHFGFDDAFWTNRAQTGVSRTVLTVGDGVGGGTDDVSVTINGTVHLNRHGDGDHTFVINSDGTLIMNSALSRWAWNGTTRNAFFKIDGGTVDFNDDIPVTGFSDGSIEFLSIGGSFSADYGGALADYASVLAALGTKFVDSTGTGTLEAIDNGTSFTVNAITPPDPNYWTGTGGATWDQATTANFTTNNESDPLAVDVFATAIASSNRATFGDEYFDSGVSQAVTQSNITIPAGGVVAGFLDFINNGVSYEIASSDANGIGTATAVSIGGTGNVTLTGTHAYSGPTSISSGATLILGDTTDSILPNSAITIGGTLVIDNALAATQDGALLAGSGTVAKQGAGTLTLTDGYTGTVGISEGTLLVEDTYTPTAFDISSGAVLELNINAFLNAPTTTFTGGGTLLKTGVEQIRWAGQVGTFDLASGALIDVQEGTFRAGSNANENWTSNLSDLNVAAGATFNTHEANVRVDAINGAGSIGSGFNGAGYANFTFGVDDGSGTFTGVIYDQSVDQPCNIVKEGSGTQVLNGFNTYTGDTTVNGGVLTFGEFGDINFVPTASGVSNQLNGSGGTVNLGGFMFIDLTNAAAAPGNQWTLVDDTNITVNYDSTFLVATLTEDFSEDAPGVWTLTSGIGFWQFEESTGVLSFNVGDDAKLWTGINGATWDQATTANFSNNIPSAALDNTTFDVATSVTGAASFADNYFDTGSSIPVTQTSVSIAAGGVQTDEVNFLNTSLSYIVESTDTNGITGSTNVNVNGPLTLRGTHSGTGETNVGAGTTLIFDAVSAPASYASALTGGGSIEKTGADVFTIPSDNSYTGSTTVTGGTLEFTNNSDTTAVIIASGATLDIDFGGRWGGATTYSGAGTLVKSGIGTLDFFGGNFDFGSGSLIDVQEGRISGSSGGTGGSENWVDNLSDLNVALGAIFTGVEGNVIFNALTGDGTLATGFNGAGYVQMTIGVDGGSGVYAGEVVDHEELAPADGLHIGHIHKVGAGSQEFSGSYRISGDTTVEEGTLTFADGGSITFYPAANTVINQIDGAGAGTGAVAINGAINFDFSGADTTPGNTWTILDTTNLGGGATIASTATVTSSSFGAFTETVLDTTFELDAGGNLWTFDVATATLSVAAGTPVSGYATWAAGFPGLTDTAILADPDFDGIVNLLEYVLNGDPTVSDPSILPDIDASGTDAVFTFDRLESSEVDTVQIFQYSTDLVTWNDIAISGTPDVEVTLGTAVDDVQSVTVTIDKTVADPEQKLFGRLSVQEVGP